jgi:hypothetical protein
MACWNERNERNATRAHKAPTMESARITSSTSEPDCQTRDELEDVVHQIQGTQEDCQFERSNIETAKSMDEMEGPLEGTPTLSMNGPPSSGSGISILYRTLSMPRF